MYEEVTVENLTELIRLFYAKAMKDEVIGHYFIDTLGEDMNNVAWGEHISLLVDFWLTILAIERRYERDPYAPHALLNGLTLESFERWKSLFFAVVDKLYDPELSSRFHKKAELFSRRFIKNLNL